MYFVVRDTSGKEFGTVEADSPQEAIQSLEVENRSEGVSYRARKAEKPEVFRYLVSEIGLSQRDLAAELEVSKGYIGSRNREEREVRRLDILALERLRELKDQ